jgi:hypothetical protein
MEDFMRTMLFVGAIAFASTVGAFAADQNWTGQISDSKCGISHMAAEHGKKMSDRECAQLCVKSGAKSVLVSEGQFTSSPTTTRIWRRTPVTQ